MKILPPAWPNFELIQIWMILLFYLIVAFLKIWPQSRFQYTGRLLSQVSCRHNTLKEAAAAAAADHDEKN